MYAGLDSSAGSLPHFVIVIPGIVWYNKRKNVEDVDMKRKIVLFGLLGAACGMAAMLWYRKYRNENASDAMSEQNPCQSCDGPNPDCCRYCDAGNLCGQGYTGAKEGPKAGEVHPDGTVTPLDPAEGGKTC